MQQLQYFSDKILMADMPFKIHYVQCSMFREALKSDIYHFIGEGLTDFITFLS